MHGEGDGLVPGGSSSRGKSRDIRLQAVLEPEGPKPLARSTGGQGFCGGEPMLCLGPPDHTFPPSPGVTQRVWMGGLPQIAPGAPA